MKDEKVALFDQPVPLNNMTTLWKQQYDEDRYLTHLSNESLRERLAQIVSNLMVLCDDGKYRPQFNVRSDRIYAPIRNLDFPRMMTDVVSEGQIRGLHIEALVDSTAMFYAERLLDESWCRRNVWFETSRPSRDRYEQPKMLFRFNGAQWNKKLHLKGQVRVSLASTYNDSRLGQARHDDELSIEWHDQSGQVFDVSTGDYYVVCFSYSYDYRLYRDFRDDAERRSCVAIRDPTELLARFRKAVERHNDNNGQSRIASLRACPVIYYDPLRSERPEVVEEVFFSKHFRYAYQTEYRFVLTPENGSAIARFCLELGSLEDIAEFIEEPIEEPK